VLGATERLISLEGNSRRSRGSLMKRGWRRLHDDRTLSGPGPRNEAAWVVTISGFDPPMHVQGAGLQALTENQPAVTTAVTNAAVAGRRWRTRHPR